MSVDFAELPLEAIEATRVTVCHLYEGHTAVIAFCYICILTSRYDGVRSYRLYFGKLSEYHRENSAIITNPLSPRFIMYSATSLTSFAIPVLVA